MGRATRVTLMRGVLVALLLSSVVLAGCSDDPAPPAASDDGTADVEVDEDAKTGAISGVVVDEAIRPIRNATVQLAGKDVNQTTDEHGQFVFQDLEPGTY